MASGCPVVSTRCGGPEEFVRDGETGYLVDSSPDAMAARIEEIVADRALRGAMSREARRLVEERYSIPRATAGFWAAFEERFS
jgi:glycosyltransferase involved in cell wall biosynthesis